MFWRKSLQSKYQRNVLYGIVFANRVTALAVLFLFLSFLLQPVHAAYAAGEGETPDESTETVSNELPAAPEEPQAADTQTSPEATESLELPEATDLTDTAEEVQTAEEDGSETPALPPTTESSAIEVADNEESSPGTPGLTSELAEELPNPVLEVSAETTAVASSDAPFSTEASEAAPEASPETPLSTSSDEQAAGEPTPSAEGSSTPESPVVENTSQQTEDPEPGLVLGAVSDSGGGDATPTLDPEEDLEQSGETVSSESVATVKTDDNYHQFRKQSCVLVGGTTYHCTVDTGEDASQTTAVFAERSTVGVMEIFMRTSDGEVKQITENGYDDTAPAYDPASQTIAWQRLINGRQQIISYDILAETEVQLTNTPTNNMEPNVGGGHVVWQWWDGADWEIMLSDGEEAIQITNNTVQDVGPVTEDGYVLWTVISEQEQIAKVYDIEARATYAIDSHEGGTIVNPRFVLVYDTRYENGDIITHGFDPLTGESAPITSSGPQDPVEVPDTDTTGETRALIQNKPAQREEFSEEEGIRTDPIIDDLDGLVITPVASSSATVASTTPQTLDLSQASTSLSAQPSTTIADAAELASSTTEPFALTDYDLIVLPPESEVTSGTSSTQD